MPPSMPKTTLTSVRDRIAAFEKQSVVSDNAVIRARYVPDVKGVNRYKHFHTPLPADVNKATMIHRLNPNQLPTLMPGKMLIISPTDDGYEENGVEKAPRRTSPRDRLPQLSQNSPSNRKQKEKDITDYLEQQAKQSQALASSSESLVKTRLSARRLNDHITTNQPERRTFAELGLRQNGVIINRNKTTSNYLNAPPPPRSQSAREVAHTTSESEASDSPISLIATETTTKEIGIQTSMKPQHYTRSVEILETVVQPPDDEDTEAAYSQIYKEEHKAMLTAISQALDSTIDRYSRVKTEQAIIHTAKKQAKVWKDAKDFIATQLVPQSIHYANRSRSAHRTAAEIVASIKCYP